jgi:RNA recognition motif-containing protein
MRYARITIDKATGRSRGSGFVCYWKTESADQAIEEAKKVLEETGANAMPVSLQDLHLPRRIWLKLIPARRQKPIRSADRPYC